MNHLHGMVLLALSIGVVFTMINKEEKRERTRYFLSMTAYLILGSLAAVWLMQLIPWQ
jgi:uncharacterized membrane protein